ncbi:MAG: ATP-binding protein [Lachnospiraceae bacterium]|nr:ATP-binding protein [Lachnospiraceae bacterium]
MEKMNKDNIIDTGPDLKLTSRLLFRLLPMQIFLALVSSINCIISGLFATNFVGTDAMTAIGLYSPINMFVFGISTMLVGGTTILCGKYIGRNEQDKVQNAFTVGNILAIAVGLAFTALYLFMGLSDSTGFLTKDAIVRGLFNEYLIGQAVGLVPLFLGNVLASFLSIENRANLSTIASIIYIIVNLILNYVFVAHFNMGAFGLALASSIGLWVFFMVQARYFFGRRAELKLFSSHPAFGEIGQILKIGVPGAATYGYQTVRGFIVNALLTLYVGNVGISALAASDNLLRLAWAIPQGMVAVSRMLMSISIGEEDRQTLTDVMRNMFKRFLPLMAAIDALIIIMAVPLTRLYFRDTSDPVYMMTVWGFRILPLCMPLSLICLHFICYAQSSDKQVLVHLLSILDGVICVAGYTALLIPSVGMNSVYIANVLNGVTTTIVIVIYAVIMKKRIPKNMEELMVVPDDFGVSDDERIDLTIDRIEEVVTVSERIKSFCDRRGLDDRRSYLASLFLEEMAGNVVEHGFTKDGKDHTIDIRVVHKGDEVILRIKDDCRPFDPSVRKEMRDPEDPAKNIGIRMIYKMAKQMEYQNMLGLNVLTVHI